MALQYTTEGVELVRGADQNQKNDQPKAIL
jgi:hypothetical protein